MPVLEQEICVRDRTLPQTPPKTASAWRVILPSLLVVLVALGAALWRLGQVPLYNTEAFYAEVSREMLENKDWVTPRFDQDRFLDKPPLYYWLVLPAYKFFGVNETAARFPTAAAMAGAVALTVLAGYLLFGGTTAWLAGLFLATTMGFFVYSHEVLVEPLLTFWIAAALVGFWGIHKDPTRKFWLWTTYVCFAFGFLTKGLTALIFPIAAIMLFLALTKNWSEMRLLFFWEGWLAFLCVTMPWHLWIAWHHPGFFHFYFIHEQLLRFLDMRTIKDAPLSSPVFLGLMVPLLFPWSFFLPQSIYYYIKQWREKRALNESELFVIIWAAVIILFFSFSGFKLDYYSLPAWPAIALAIAHYIVERLRQPGPSYAIAIPIGATFGLGIAGLLFFPKSAEAYGLPLPNPWFAAALDKTFVCLLAGSVTAAIFLSLKKFRLALLSLAAMMLPLIAMAQQSMVLLSPQYSNKELALAAERCLKTLPASTRLVQTHTDEDIYVGGDVYYTGRKVWFVMPAEQQVFPLGRRFYVTPQQLASWWQGNAPVLVIGETRATSVLLKNVSSFTLAQRGGKVLVSNQPACGA